MRTIALLLLTACTPEPDGDPSPTPILRCGSEDLLDAPPAVETGAGLIAPIDLQWVDARATVTTDGLLIEATAAFLTDDATARPVLELGPVPDAAELDGVPVTLERTTVSDPSREVVALDTLGPCEEHTLTVQYSLPNDWFADPDEAVRFEATPDGVFWAAGLEDNAPGRFLSMWVPSNLLFDRFDFALEVDVSGLDTDHELIATGQTAETAAGWQLEWSGIQAHSPFWVLSPTAITEHRSAAVPLSGGDVTVEVRSLTTDPGADPDAATDRAALAIADFSSLFGSYGHGDRYVLWIRDDASSSMEYDGATLTQMGAIETKILHSWFARGASPVADLHGWVDEGITSWVADLFPLREVALDLDATPRRLQVGEDEWAGASLALENYFYGSALFADIASRHGVDGLVGALRAFYAAYFGASYRSVDLEEHLTCWFDDDGVRESFLHTGYGLEGPAEPRPTTWCR